MQGPETRLSLLASLNDPSASDAWAEFDGLYRPLVYRVARGKGLQHADAEDLAQQVLAVVNGAIDSFDPDADGSFRGWLFTITRNLVVNHLTRGPHSRKHGPIGSGDSKVQQMLMQHPSDESHTATLFQLEYRRGRFQQAARKLKSQFNEETWQAFWRTSVDGQSISDVAEQLARTPGAIRMARCRVLARIRGEVQTMNEGE
ncbi:sigma-70 family RNA polymerase sigma factor [Stieleria varia]|uniref:sigma-70 family RNA polymerase sigma factor n=1 Tax=Stieleria varia TaxID=2528005 RepID=UPI001E4472EB|nr:sigma-70 family RNA polymerase sigma factor [Stieleria varia]